MGKFAEIQREEEELNLEMDENEPVEEPTDDEMEEIKHKLNTISFEDWEHVGHS